MTRNNLAANISWLLSHQVPLHPGVPVTAQAITDSTVAAPSRNANFLEEETELEPLRVPSSASQSRQTVPTVNVGQSFKPPPPPSLAPLSRPREPTIIIGEEKSMGKPVPATRPPRSTLMSLPQIATPASTIALSTLGQNYSRLLRENNVTPSARTPVDRSFTKTSKQLQTPQTTRQSPHPTLKLKTEPVESVDLTGDDSGIDHQLRSSSSEVGFGEPQMLWREDSASRAEPLVKNSTKRKSDEISTGAPRNGEYRGKSVEAFKPDDHDSLDEFVDIDAITTYPTQYQQKRFRNSGVKPTGPITRQGETDTDFEEYEAAKTISTSGTRTLKQSSRVPSVTEITPPRQISPVPVSTADSESITLPATQSPKPPSMVQVEVSPVPKDTNSPAAGRLLTPRPRQNHRLHGTIEDSDEEALSDVEGRICCSPGSLVKKSPKIMDKLKISKLRPLPGQLDEKTRDVKASKPRTGSPLRPISQNVTGRQDSVPSPFQRDTRTKVPVAFKPSSLDSSQSSSFSLTDSDKRLVSLYLTKPLAITSYHQRVRNLFSQNAVESMAYVDREEPAPKQLKEARTTLLEMCNAYGALEELGKSYGDLIAEKRALARKIYEQPGVRIDTSADDERMTMLSREIQKVEKEVGRLLYTSGAVQDGFGTGEDHGSAQASTASKLQENMPPLTPRQTHLGGTQVVFQTQFGSLPQLSSSNTHQRKPEEVADRSSRENKHAQDPSSTLARGSSAGQIPNRAQPNWNTPNSILRPFDIHRNPSPVDYEFDDDDFDDLLQEEQAIQESLALERPMSKEIEEDYGDFDDDEDLVEIAQQIESRGPFGEPTSTLIPRSAPSDDNVTQTKSRLVSGKKTMYSTVDPAHADMLKHPWSADVKRALKDRFKLRGFRQNQLEAINATLAGRDAFILMPTGGGKSLCYQLPAVVQSGKTRGVTLVISPLLSLMNDQVEQLKKRNIQAFLVNGEQQKTERELVFSALRETHPDQFIQLLYITPEMIGKSEALLSALDQLHRKKRLARIVIDEAHCVSQWGHDFRPDYKTLLRVRERFPGVPFIALTATATRNVKADCIHNLGMKSCKEFKQSFNRPNLFYEVRSKKGKGVGAEVLESMCSLILKDYKNQTGIVYTLSRKGCEDLAEKLRGKGIKAHHFHAAMEPTEKNAVQRDWQAGKWQVVVATIAFGMGIDKPDVRFVIHHTMPKSLEGYYQETGRAGRDGKPSGCYLYYGYQDTAVLKRFIDESDGTDEVKERQREMLKRMVQFCENRSDCRRADILAYFGEAFSKENCNHNCDNCSSDAVFEPKDMTRQAQAALHVVKQAQHDNMTLLHVVDILRGTSTSKIKAHNHQNLQGYGSVTDLPRGEIERLFTRLLMEDALEEHNVIRGAFPRQYIHLGKNCRDFMEGRRKLKLMMKVSGSPAGAEKTRPVRKSGGASGPRGSTTQPPSTMLTSPLGPSSRRYINSGRGRYVTGDAEEGDEFGSMHDFTDNDTESDDAFEPVRSKTMRQDRRETALGPPITTDNRMKDLPELHRDIVDEFVAEAKKVEGKLRNQNGHTRAYFTESDFREMAINWTLTTEDMLQIPGISEEKVHRYGKKLLKLIEQFHNTYQDIMSHDTEIDMDANHKNVIDLCSDDDMIDEDEYGEEEEDRFTQEEQPSKYFIPANVQAFNDEVARAQTLTQRKHKTPEPAPKSFRGGSKYGRGKFRGGKKSGGRRSAGSASGSGPGTTRSVGGHNNSGISKRGQPRKVSSTGARKNNAGRSGSSAPPRSLNLMKAFGNKSGGGSSGGGIGMMPT